MIRPAVGLAVLAFAGGCGGEGPLGIPVRHDGVTYAGVAVVDVTPTIVETFTDLDGDATFDGCLDDPEAARPGCDEPFDDANGNGWFDAVWIGGYGPLRPARGVHDPVTARALVLAHDGSYVAFVTLDFVGLAAPRIRDARGRLAADGFDPDRLVVASSHNHQGPDTMGLWGDPYDLAAPVSGLDRNHQAFVADAIEGVVREAAASMEPVALTVGTVALRDVSPLYSGADFGGYSPDPIQLGLIHDRRDPIVVSDQLLVLQGNRPDGTTVFTLTNWSGHPEVWGSRNDEISSDYVGVVREALEDTFGGTALHLPECLGGMQSALGGAMPLREEDGTPVLRICDGTASDARCAGKAAGEIATFPDGTPEPVWAPPDTWAFVRSHGHAIADAAVLALAGGEAIDAAPIRVEVEAITVPIDNVVYRLLGGSGLFETDYTDLVTDPTRCPEAAGTDVGCVETRTSRLQIGPIGWAAVPGELLPELAWGLPDDPGFVRERDDPSARGRNRGGIWFPQHDPACDTVDVDACMQTDGFVDGCDCLSLHAVPYRLSDAGLPPILSHHDTRYRAAISMADDYLSYILPEPDVNRDVSLLSERNGDHYEDTVTPGAAFGTRILEAHARIAQRWDASAQE